MKPYRGFADLIRGRRKGKGLHLDDVADAIGWSIPYLSELERGIKQPPTSGEQLVKLSALLEIPLNELRREATLSRRAIELDLEGASATQRRLAALLARRFEAGLSDNEAQDLIDRLSQHAGLEDEY
jgi:transcriptional regulator with XRE-family HTH domain